MLLVTLFIALTFTHSLSLCEVLAEPWTAPISYASNDHRPFWTEQASFTFDDTLYVIGVATKATSVEAGRQAAFINGLAEIRNYAQVDNLDGLQTATQMTFEESQGDGTVSIWRLLRVSLGALSEARVGQNRTKMRLRGVKEGVREVQQVSRNVAPIAPSTGFTTGPDKQRDRSVILEKPELPRASVEAASRATPTLKPASVKINLPDAPSVADIPTRSTHVIKGWSRTSAGQLAIEAEDRRDWQVPLFNAADLSYRKSR